MIASFRKSSQIWSAPAACLLLLVGAVALTNAQTNQPATQSSSIADLTQTARQVVTDMAKGDFDGATDHFDNTMKAAISSKQLQAAWDGVVQQAGPFQQIASTRSEQFAAHRIIYVTCKFQDGLADAKVVFDKTGQIGGLWLQPTPIDSKTSPPAQPSAISFTGEDLKIEPYKEGGLFQAVASVHNTSAQQSGRWEVRLYKGEPKKGNEVSPGGAGGVGPIEPGKTWNEASLPFSLSEGQSTITAVLTPEGATDTTTAIRAAVTVTIRDGSITSCTTAAPNRVAAVQPPPFHPEDMKIVPYTEGNLFYVRVKLHNTSNKTTARCELKYFRGDPRNASPAGGNGATNIDPIAPGDVSDSMSLPFALSEGRNVIACVLRPVDATADTPSQIVALTVTIKDGKIVSQEPAPISSHGETLPQPATQNDPTANDHLLNEGQRLYAEWTDTYFDTIIAAKQYADLSQQAKAELEPKWLAMLNGPKNHGYIQAICNLGAIRSKKAVPPLLGIAIERREKDNADRHFAVEALSMIGDASVVPLLIPLTYHYNQNTRFWAQIALVRLTGQNFGDNWQAWAKWWNSLGKQPQAATVAVKWPCSNPEWLEPEKQKEADAQWIENHGGSAKSARSQEPGPADKAAAAPQEARTLTSQGQSLFDKKNYNEAMATFQQVVDKYPQWSGAENAQMMVGLCHSQLGQHDKAIAAFQHAIHDYPNQDLAATYFYLGSACERVARMDDAVAAYEQSVQRASAIGRGQAFPGKDAQQRIDALKSPKTVSTGE